jgi:hypothetical protein
MGHSTVLGREPSFKYEQGVDIARRPWQPGLILSPPLMRFPWSVEASTIEPSTQ